MARRGGQRHVAKAPTVRAELRPRVVFVNRYFAPDLSASSQMLTDLTRRLAADGFEIEVVCSRQRYDDPRADLPTREHIAGALAIRVGTTRFGRGGLPGRALDYASFYLSARRALSRTLRPGDVVVAMTDPPLIGAAVQQIVRRRGAKLVNWLHDVFPEAATRLGVGRWPHWLDTRLVKLRDESLSAAEVNVTIGERMQQYLLGRGIPPDRLVVIENWADSAFVAGMSTDGNRLRSRLGLSDRFVVSYSGNLGRAHEFETLLGAAERLRRDSRISFLMIGGGIGMEALERRARELGLENMIFLPYQPREALSDSLAAADLHVACLQPALEGLIVPSKLYGILAAARPAVFIGAHDGEAASVLRAAGCGSVVEPGDAEALATEIERQLADPARRARAGAAAREAFFGHYTAERGARQWIDLLETARFGLAEMFRFGDRAPS